MPGFTLQHLWYVSVFATTVQMLITLWLLKRTADQAMRRATTAMPVAVPAVG
jgi:hypothetical protein